MATRSTVARAGKGRPILDGVAQLGRKRLLVGVPGDTAPREAAPGQKSAPPSNALVGYVMELGDDELHIPPRPFLAPGVQSAKPAITKGMHKAVTSALSGKPAGIDDGLNEAGLAAVASVHATMIAGGFAPLSDRTIEARARRRDPDTGRLVGAATSRNARNFLKLRAEGTPDAVLHDAGLATPLLDTRSLFRSVTHIIRTK